MPLLMVEYDGRRQNLSAWCRELGLAYHTTWNRLAEGATPHEAFTLPRNARPQSGGRAAQQYEHRGNWQTLKQWAAEYDLSEPTLRQRMNAGKPLEEALAPSRQRGARLIEYNGKMQTIADHARDAGMSPGTVSGRVNGMGWSLEKSLSEAVRPNVKKFKSQVGAYQKARRRVRALLPPPLVAGHCDLCGNIPADGRALCWDHDHVLEELGFPLIECHRGWLCVPCNSGLGKLGDNMRGLMNAARYYRTVEHRAADPEWREYVRAGIADLY